MRAFHLHQCLKQPSWISFSQHASRGRWKTVWPCPPPLLCGSVVPNRSSRTDNYQSQKSTINLRWTMGNKWSREKWKEERKMNLCMTVRQREVKRKNCLLVLALTKHIFTYLIIVGKINFNYYLLLSLHSCYPFVLSVVYFMLSRCIVPSFTIWTWTFQQFVL